MLMNAKCNITSELTEKKQQSRDCNLSTKCTSMQLVKQIITPLTKLDGETLRKNTVHQPTRLVLYFDDVRLQVDKHMIKLYI